MATSSATLFVTGGTHLQTSGLRCENIKAFGANQSQLVMRQNSKHLNHHRKLTVSAKYSENSGGGGGGDFVAGFLLGGAVFGTLAYIFAPQILLWALRVAPFLPMLHWLGTWGY